MSSRSPGRVTSAAEEFGGSRACYAVLREGDPGDMLTLLSAHGQLRKALNSPPDLRSIKRRKSTKTTPEIITDARGRW